MVNSESLSVIREKMPASTYEQFHYHKKSQQFFYILSGVATFEIDEITLTVEPDNGIHIKPGVKHRILNNGFKDLEFLVISEPRSHGDRFNIE